MKTRPPWKPKPLTPDQAKYLRAHAATTSGNAMAAHLGCSRRFLSRRLKDLGLTWIKCRKWSDLDELRLRSLAGKMTVGAISRQMRRDFNTVTLMAKRLDIDLTFDFRRLKALDAQLRSLVAEGLTRHQIAGKTGRPYNTVRQHLKRLGLDVKWERSMPGTGVPRPSRAKNPGVRPVQSEPAPRERIGIHRVRSIVIRDSVEWCQRCHAPVVNTPQAWAEHNARVHIAPVWTPNMAPLRRFA